MVIVPAIDEQDGFDGYGSQTFSGAAYGSVFFNVYIKNWSGFTQ